MTELDLCKTSFTLWNSRFAGPPSGDSTGQVFVTPKKKNPSSLRKYEVCKALRIMCKRGEIFLEGRKTH